MDIAHTNATHNGHVPIPGSSLRSPTAVVPTTSSIFDPCPLTSSNYMKLSPFLPANHSGVAFSMPFNTKSSMVSSPPVPSVQHSVAVPYVYVTNGNHVPNIEDGYPNSPYQTVCSTFPTSDPGGYPVFTEPVPSGAAIHVSQCPSVVAPIWNRAQNSSTGFVYPSCQVSAPARFLTANGEKTERPQMPIYQEAKMEENFAQMDPDYRAENDKKKGFTLTKTSTHRRGRQRSSDPLSSHAVYARLNRERRKKYIADLEVYRNTMKLKQVSGRDVLQKIHDESQRLTEEIAALRQNLQKNGALMVLLTGKKDWMFDAKD